jgi:TRAP-type mannitol/chloroaromatic compound transport system permease small subunit
MTSTEETHSQTTPETVVNESVAPDTAPGVPDLLARMLAGSVVWVTAAFLLNSLLTFAWDWPGVPPLLSYLGWPGIEPLTTPLGAAMVGQGSAQALVYVVSVAGTVMWVMKTRGRSLQSDADAYAALAAFVVRAAFWSVFLIGLVDAVISFLRVENFLPVVFGEKLTTDLGLSKFRGQYVHIPLMAVSCVIAFFTRSLSVVWLALLIVLAEFQIVISRFIFSYEQAFMGDLVRFWYASLFLLASAYSLVAEGHVRVDVFYAGFSARGKARTNALGSMLLGVPICWVILTMGMWSKGSSLSNPLLSFEISQSGFGMYVKYLMAGFLIIFAASMVAQFASYFLESVAVLRQREPERTDDTPHVESII